MADLRKRFQNFFQQKGKSQNAGTRVNKQEYSNNLTDLNPMMSHQRKRHPPEINLTHHIQLTVDPDLKSNDHLKRAVPNGATHYLLDHDFEAEPIITIQDFISLITLTNEKTIIQKVDDSYYLRGIWSKISTYLRDELIFSYGPTTLDEWDCHLDLRVDGYHLIEALIRFSKVLIVCLSDYLNEKKQINYVHVTRFFLSLELGFKSGLKLPNFDISTSADDAFINWSENFPPSFTTTPRDADLSKPKDTIIDFLKSDRSFRILWFDDENVLKNGFFGDHIIARHMTEMNGVHHAFLFTDKDQWIRRAIKCLMSVNRNGGRKRDNVVPLITVSNQFEKLIILLGGLEMNHCSTYKYYPAKMYSHLVKYTEQLINVYASSLNLFRNDQCPVINKGVEPYQSGTLVYLNMKLPLVATASMKVGEAGLIQSIPTVKHSNLNLKMKFTTDLSTVHLPILTPKIGNFIAYVPTLIENSPKLVWDGVGQFNAYKLTPTVMRQNIYGSSFPELIKSANVLTQLNRSGTKLLTVFLPILTFRELKGYPHTELVILGAQNEPLSKLKLPNVSIKCFGLEAMYPHSISSNEGVNIPPHTNVVLSDVNYHVPRDNATIIALIKSREIIYIIKVLCELPFTSKKKSRRIFSTFWTKKEKTHYIFPVISGESNPLNREFFIIAIPLYLFFDEKLNKEAPDEEESSLGDDPLQSLVTDQEQVPDVNVPAFLRGIPFFHPQNFVSSLDWDSRICSFLGAKGLTSEYDNPISKNLIPAFIQKKVTAGTFVSKNVHDALYLGVHMFHEFSTVMMAEDNDLTYLSTGVINVEHRAFLEYANLQHHTIDFLPRLEIIEKRLSWPVIIPKISGVFESLKLATKVAIMKSLPDDVLMILDIGCQKGSYSCIAREIGAVYLGIDVTNYWNTKTDYLVVGDAFSMRFEDLSSAMTLALTSHAHDYPHLIENGRYITAKGKHATTLIVVMSFVLPLYDPSGQEAALHAIMSNLRGIHQFSPFALLLNRNTHVYAPPTVQIYYQYYKYSPACHILSQSNDGNITDPLLIVHENKTSFTMVKFPEAHFYAGDEIGVRIPNLPG